MPKKIKPKKSKKPALMTDADADAYLALLDQGKVKVTGAEARIFASAQESTNRLNQTIKVIENLEAQLETQRSNRLQLQGERFGHLRNLISLETDRRNAK